MNDESEAIFFPTSFCFLYYYIHVLGNEPKQKIDKMIGEENNSQKMVGKKLCARCNVVMEQNNNNSNNMKKKKHTENV